MSEQASVVAASAPMRSPKARTRISHSVQVSWRKRTGSVLLSLLSCVLAVGLIGTASAEYPITDTTRALGTVKLMLAAEARGDITVFWKAFLPRSTCGSRLKARLKLAATFSTL